MTTALNEDIETLAAEPGVFHLDGADVDVKLEQLRTRQLFKFLKIITSGAGPLLADLSLSADTSPEELTQELIAILMISIPEAEDETIEFLKSMVSPIGLVEPERTKADREINIQLYTDLYSKLNNPDAGDTIDIIVQIVKNESPNLVALGKKIAALLPSVAKPTTSSKKRSSSSTRSGS